MIPLLRKSILRVSLLKISKLLSNRPLEIRICPDESADFSELALFGFAATDTGFKLNINSEQSQLLRQLKNQLHDYVSIAPKIGRGYVINAEHLNPAALAALNMEYGDVAWGITNWARHSVISRDELDVIATLPPGGRALEIGAGSGRVTSAMLPVFDSVTATDIVPEVLQHLSGLGPKVIPAMDDIVASAIKDNEFDIVTFWENGLGGIATSVDRQKAFDHMARVTKPDGLIVIAIRQLLPVSVDHLMIASQTDEVMGIYHTFSDLEMTSYQRKDLTLENVIVGSERPAGGIEKFFIYRKARS